MNHYLKEGSRGTGRDVNFQKSKKRPYLIGLAAVLLSQVGMPLTGLCDLVVGWESPTVSFSAWTPMTVPEGLTNENVISVAAGDGGQRLALTAQGQVVGWGNNGTGQINVPAGLGRIKAIATGYNHSLVLKEDGTVVAFGLYTQVPPGLSNVVAIAAGWQHNLALLANGLVVGWAQSITPGIDNYGQEQVPTDLKDVVAIDAIRYTSVALTAEGKVVAWGDLNWNGYPLENPPGLSNVVAIAKGNVHILALKSDGTVTAWGSVLGSDAINVPPGLSHVQRIAAGHGISMAMKDDGTVVAWGVTNGLPVGMTGIQAASARSGMLALVADGPPQITSPLIGREVLQGGATFFYVTAVGTEPLRYQWRHNGMELSGETNAFLALTNVQGNQAGTYSVIVTNVHGAAVSTDSLLSIHPVAVPLVFTVQPANYSTYLRSSAALTGVAAGTEPISYQWRLNGKDLPGATTTRLAFESVQLKDNGFYSLVASNAAGAVESAQCCLSVGLVAAWGGWHYPQAAQAMSLPPGLSNAVEVSARGFHSMALKADGTVLDWGVGVASAPAGLKDVVAIAAGTDHSLALKDDGTVVAWGGNSSGQTSVPAGLDNVIAIAAGNLASLALRSDGTLFSWGIYPEANGLTNIATMAIGLSCVITAGRDGSVVEWRTPPRPHPELSNVVAFASSSSQIMALKADGQFAAYSWLFDYGRSGPIDYVGIAAGETDHYLNLTLDGEGNVASDPYMAPATVFDVIGVAAGTDHFLALLADPDGPQTMRLELRRPRQGAGYSFKIRGAVGAKPVIVEASSDFSFWFPVQTNWLHGTASEVPFVYTNSAASFFRLRQP